MARHPNFPESTHAILDPAVRWFPADEALRESSAEKLMPPLVPQLRKKISDDPDLSRRHARIFWTGSSWMLEDLNSSNGTFIGEIQAARRLSGSTQIKDGHIFRVRHGSDL